eukprot:5786210-Amphidinium_carterae.1
MAPFTRILCDGTARVRFGAAAGKSVSLTTSSRSIMPAEYAPATLQGLWGGFSLLHEEQHPKTEHGT